MPKTTQKTAKAIETNSRKNAPFRLARLITTAYGSKYQAGPYWGATFPCRNKDGSPWVGMCASLARRFYQATHEGKTLPFAQKDADKDRDIDANDMEQLEVKGIDGNSYAVTGPRAWERAREKGLLRVGGRCYFKDNANGHVVTIVRIRDADSLGGVDVIENTTSTLRGPGTVLTTLDRVCNGRSDRITSIGYYGTGVFL